MRANAGGSARCVPDTSATAEDGARVRGFACARCTGARLRGATQRHGAEAEEGDSNAVHERPHLVLEQVRAREAEEGAASGTHDDLQTGARGPILVRATSVTRVGQSRKTPCSADARSLSSSHCHIRPGTAWPDGGRRARRPPGVRCGPASSGGRGPIHFFLVEVTFTTARVSLAPTTQLWISMSTDNCRSFPLQLFVRSLHSSVLLERPRPPGGRAALG